MSVPMIYPPRGVAVAYNLAAGIGTTRLLAVVCKASAVLNTDDPRYRIYAVYYLPPAKFEYQGGYYPLPSLFVDFKVDATASRR